MAEQSVDEKSDDLDIVSVGKLYQGPWEKKYWSSSRGKDRHPYPVGYVALRTCSGNTFKMAVLEGLKGPEFAISSTDGQSCSGQTPDIAWEGMQKKSCVRIKFWRGKRFSCKIDGSELFGFKNPLVTRLLRGLKGNDSPIADQSLPSSCFGNGQSEGTDEHHMRVTVHSNLVKTEVKEKKSKKRKEIHAKSVSGTKYKKGQPQDHSQICERNDSKADPLDSSNSNENNISLEQMAFNGNNKSQLLSAEDGLQIQSSIPSENLEKKKCLSVLEEDINLLKNKENNDFSQLDVSFTSSKTADENGDPDPPVQKDAQMLDSVNLYAPDTMDPALDSACNPAVDFPEEIICSINDKLNSAEILVSEKCVIESQTRTGSDNSDKDDSDSVGQEITNSMMTLLLPRALPLLKTYSRKKKTSQNSGKKGFYKKSQEERKGTDQCLEDEPPDTSSLLPGLEDSTAIAPDSFESPERELMESSQAGKVEDAFRADQNTCGTELCTHEGHHVCPNVQPSEEVWQIGKTTSKVKSHEDVDLVLEKSTQEDGNIMDSYDFGNTPPVYDPETRDVKISPCHTEGTATTADAKSTTPVISILQDHCETTKNDDTCLNKLHKDELQNIFELVGSYVHPTPISMVMLRTKGNEVFICVLCGYLMENNRTLFLYKTSLNGENRGCPSFIGHTKIINSSGDQILLQFTPDAKSIVLLNNIKPPYCREGGVSCQFLPCTPDCSEKNAIKVVQVKLGYVHVICKLKTTNNVSCILVCEPSYLVAAEESGRMNYWTMNSTWSAPTDQGYLPMSDSMPNCLVEMKRIPNFPSFVIGQSAFGDFYLWDLTRRVLVSKFTAPGTSFCSFLPMNLFRKKEVADMMEETQRWSLETVKEEDLSLVLLVSKSDLNDGNLYKASGGWSLALLAKSKLISLNALDASATVVGASAGHGIIGTRHGSVYIWELSTGTKLGYLSHCKGATVSCLAADDSDSGVFAVAVDGSQLQVYATNRNQD